MEEIPRPREAPPEPTIRSEQASEGPTPDTTMTTTMDDSILAESVAQSEKFQNVPEISPELMENSSMQLRQKIDKIKNEKFDAKSKVKSSSVLQKTIRDCGVQMVNHDIECEVYNNLIELDIDKENLLEEEIQNRLSRVKKVEIAEPIRCSYGQPDINYFRTGSKIYHDSPTVKNLAHETPTLEKTKPQFINNQIFDIQEFLARSEVDYWSV